MLEENFDMAKKKFARQSLKNNINMAVGFTYPKLHEGKKFYVDYYVYDPATDSMRRIKKHFDSIKNKRERNKAISHYILTISEKLRQGWNPMAECGNKGLTTINSVFEKYRDSIKQYSRRKTELSYSSRLNILESYISEQPYPPQYIYQLTKEFYIEFLDWLLTDRAVGARTRNNYRGWLASFCNWLKDRNYISTNPAEEISNIREDNKKRKALSSHELRMVFEHLMNTDKHFLLACLFEYYTFIRPTELSHLKIGDISIKNECVYVSGEFSKNRKDGSVALNRNLILLMLDLGVFRYSSDCYLFGHGFKPSVSRVGPDQFNKKWKVIRNRLKLKPSLQFYSLKDAGIRDLANERGIVIARDQARHSDISTTNKYLCGRDLKGPDGARDFNGWFNIDEAKNKEG